MLPGAEECHDGAVPAGRIVIINGTSSAGKSALVHRFWERRAEAGQWWLPIAIDDFQIRVPPAFFSAPGFEGPHAAHGFFTQPADEGITLGVGDQGRQLHAAYHRTVALWAEHGFDVIVDEVVFDAEAAEDWRVALEGSTVTWVGLHCEEGTLVDRERRRGDRFPGLALGLASTVHRHVTYDLELDSTEQTVEDLVVQLEEGLGL